MKLKTGFVSNSSTTSFVIVGFPHPADSMDDEDFEMSVDWVDGDDVEIPGNLVIIGKYIAKQSSEDWGLETAVFDWQSLVDDVNQIRANLGSDEPVKIYRGTMCS